MYRQQKQQNHREDGTDDTEASAVSPRLKYLAVAPVLGGLLAAAAGGLRAGALFLSSAVVLFGAVKLLTEAEDRAVSFVILVVGIFSGLGVVGHLLSGL
jgi:hypothetical protein